MNLLLASFPSPEALLEGARAMRGRSFGIVDAFTPFPVEGIGEYLPQTDRGVRSIMLGTGALVAVLCYVLEWWTSVIDYPIISGNRPLNSWPVFVLFPFEFAVLSAAIAGLVVFLFKTRLPRYHDAIFENDLLQRAYSDDFILALEAPEDEDARSKLIMFCSERGATATREVAV